MRSERWHLSQRVFDTEAARRDQHDLGRGLHDGRSVDGPMDSPCCPRMGSPPATGMSSGAQWPTTIGGKSHSRTRTRGRERGAVSARRRPSPVRPSAMSRRAASSTTRGTPAPHEIGQHVGERERRWRDDALASAPRSRAVASRTSAKEITQTSHTSCMVRSGRSLRRRSSLDTVDAELARSRARTSADRSWPTSRGDRPLRS